MMLEAAIDAVQVVAQRAASQEIVQKGEFTQRASVVIQHAHALQSRLAEEKAGICTRGENINFAYHLTKECLSLLVDAEEALVAPVPGDLHGAIISEVAAHGLMAFAFVVEPGDATSIQLLEQLALDLDRLALSLFSGLCRLDNDCSVGEVDHGEERWQLALQGICAWTLSALGRTVGFENLTSTLLWEWTAGDPTWTLVLTKGVLLFPSPSSLGITQLIPACVSSVLGLASPEVAHRFSIDSSTRCMDELQSQVGLAIMSGELAKHRASVAEAFVACKFARVLVQIIRPANAIGLLSFLCGLLQPEIALHAPAWASTSDYWNAAYLHAQVAAKKLSISLARYAGIIWHILSSSLIGELAGRIPPGFLQDCADLAYFVPPADRVTEQFLQACLACNVGDMPASEDASAIACLCIVAANAQVLPESSALTVALVGFSSIGQDMVFDRWARWRVPVKMDWLEIWAGAILNPPQVESLKMTPPAPIDEEIPPASPQTYQQPRSRGAVLKNLVHDAPQEFRCQLDGQLMMDPVQSPYGHVFERSEISSALQFSVGKCPATGRPLRLDECVRLPELRRQILFWVRQQRGGYRAA